jgi:hypothetical protein
MSVANFAAMQIQCESGLAREEAVTFKIDIA